MKQAVLGLAVRHDGAILAVYNHKHGAWALPGGKVELSEDLDDALMREMLEEVGAVVSPVELVWVGPTYVEADKDRVVYVYSVELHENPYARELNQPVGWVTRDFLTGQKHEKAAAMLRDLFAKLDAK